MENSFIQMREKLKLWTFIVLKTLRVKILHKTNKECTNWKVVSLTYICWEWILCRKKSLGVMNGDYKALGLTKGRKKGARKGNAGKPSVKENAGKPSPKGAAGKGNAGKLSPKGAVGKNQMRDVKENAGKPSPKGAAVKNPGNGKAGNRELQGGN